MITKAYTDFFNELKESNTKAWFHANKKRYETDAKLPFLNLLSELIPELRNWDSRILQDEKKAIFRINRDIRFSKDKTPYHIILKAGFSPNGKKSMLPGYYLGITADTIHVGGGLFMVKPPELKMVRSHITKNTEDFLEIINSKNFIDKLKELKGETAKRIDKSFEALASKTEHIYKKQFYAMTELPLSAYYDSPKLITVIKAHFEAIRPLNEFLNAALIK
ncbi:DUF2461 domain-containing protein [uncultured Algibacter sp.]|uniref:DUF2461 domain-containing protein n=1 Tax=uncultured Algibacter sp. TaxID=298659 RepID=UPI0026134E97|nr:DUF2461 domain-containing protein [uncultured Algibacter sp.]